MSSFNILGFFKLKSGCRISVQKPNSTYSTYYAHYDTKIWNIDNSALPADLRVFITSNAPLLPDNTVAFAVCTVQSIATPSTAQSTATNSLVLDALTFVVLPGDPSTDAYNDQLPDERTSMVFGVGRITGSPQTLDDGHSSRVVTLAVADYVRAETKTSTIQCVFDLSTARWTRAPVPQANSVMQFYGLCRDVNPAGLLRIKLESVALNISSNGSAPSADSQSPSHTITSAPVTPSKRRKFSSPSPPSTGPDPPSSAASSAPSASPSKITDPSLITVAETPESAAAPMHYSHLFQQYPQYMGGGPATTSSFPSPFAPPPMYTMPGYPPFPSPFPGYGVYTPGPYNSQGEYMPGPPSADPRASPSAPTRPATSSSAESGIPVQDSAFDRSASDPYSYPMTQIPASRNQPSSINLTSNPALTPHPSSASATVGTTQTPTRSGPQPPPPAATTSSNTSGSTPAVNMNLRSRKI